MLTDIPSSSASCRTRRAGKRSGSTGAISRTSKPNSRHRSRRGRSPSLNVSENRSAVIPKRIFTSANLLGFEKDEAGLLVVTPLEVLPRLDDHELQRRAYYRFDEMSAPGRRVVAGDDDVRMELGG